MTDHQLSAPAIQEQVQALLAGARPLPLVTAGATVLRRRAQPYAGQLGPQLLDELIEAMRETMLTAPGVGLAAPQIGLGLQLAVLEDPATVTAEIAAIRDRRPLPFRVLVNPTYTAVDDRTAAFYEGCLSVPGYQAVVERPASVRLRGQDEHGRELDEQVDGWSARIVQHETDHLAGTLYLDKALLRSLTGNDHYLQRWGTAAPTSARSELGF